MADLEVVAVPTTPEGVLCRAADYYTQGHDWIRGDYGTEEGACLVGACLWAVGVDPVAYDEGADDLPPLVVQAAERLAERLDLEPFDIAQCLVVEWNDSECKSKEQAVSVLRAAAGGCKEAGGG
jgi:hypothetical protein